MPPAGALPDRPPHQNRIKSWQLAALVFLSSPASPAWPNDQPAPLRQTFSVYQAQGVDANLIDVIPKAVRGDLDFERSYFAGVGYQRFFANPRLLQRILDTVGAPNIENGVDLVAVKHWGLQHNAELAAAYVLRTPMADLAGITLRFAVGFGLSYALGTPSYEDGPKDDPQRRYRLQNFNTYEFEWGLRAVRSVSLVTRIHHRSGIYGLIAPRHVGSNFMAVGLRAAF
ncbi:MAG TPA: hypothetical protein VFR86_10590 [Burkholderiaceae bacterium]|nr:hypothetical protein [Burkholderiaceae bacterium]